MQRCISVYLVGFVLRCCFSVFRTINADHYTRNYYNLQAVGQTQRRITSTTVPKSFYTTQLLSLIH